MPEGPEVRITADVLHAGLQGYSFAYFYVTLPPHRLTSQEERVFTNRRLLFEAMQTDEAVTVESIVARGKKIVWTLSGDQTLSLQLVSFLGMSGAWELHTVPDLPEPLIEPWEPQMEANVLLQILFRLVDSKQSRPRWIHVKYRDQRGFGTLQVVTSPQHYAKIFSTQGPDWLADEISLELFTQVASQSKARHLSVAVFLLAQEFFAGVGNYLRAEILYAVRLHPFTSMSSLVAQPLLLEALYLAIRRIIHAAYLARGFTIQDYRVPDLTPGRYRCVVYGCTHDPLGYSVIRTTDSTKRTVHWVPEVQTLT